jgi:tetratricopeptide (TPR) repeat protein
MESRVAALEAQVKALQQALSGISLEKASADRQKIFASEDGYLKADEYAAAGQHAIAGEGYLTFLQNHPQHPDARDVMKKARDSFIKAGYKDKAFWVHEEMMKASPQQQLADMEELAHLEKDAGLYDRASQHMAQAAQLDPNAESRLWKRLYWAYYVQLGSGNRAGLEALQQVQQEISASGVANPLLHQRAQQHLVEWQQQLAREQ